MHGTDIDLRDQSWVDAINLAVDEAEEHLIELRERLHCEPELSDHEFATTDMLVEALRSCGIEGQTFDSTTGLVADIQTGLGAKKKIGLRADIDALPIQDQKDAPYRSKVEGVMHACGHDAHSTMLFGALSVLHELNSEGKLPWPIDVRGLFQPAEEKATGAERFLELGVCEGVDMLFALHVDPAIPVGSVGVRSGVLTAGCDLFHVTFRGEGGHGARPHQTTDPIDAATAWVQQAYWQIGRRSNPFDPTVISVGVLRGGETPNVIPTAASLSGTVRSMSKKGQDRAIRTLEEISEAIEASTGCEITFETSATALPVNNDPTAIELMTQAATLAIGSHCITEITHPSMGSEDFSYYQQKVRGALVRLGIAGRTRGKAPLHTPLFDIDPSALAVGTRLLATVAILASRP